MSALVGILVSGAVGYLFGSIPNGYLVGKYVAGIDVRTLGSGKIGATNVRRAIGWKGFFLVLLLDALKGALAVLVARWLVAGYAPWAEAVAGIAAVVGHSWPIFLSFRGGRGVAVGMGAMLVMLPPVILIAAVVAVPLVILSRYVSLGSVTGSAIVPVITLAVVLIFKQPWPYFVYALVAASLIILKHRDNIERLVAGTERRI